MQTQIHPPPHSKSIPPFPFHSYCVPFWFHWVSSPFCILCTMPSIFRVLATSCYKSVNLCEPIMEQNSNPAAIWLDGTVLTPATGCCKNLENTVPPVISVPMFPFPVLQPPALPSKFHWTSTLRECWPTDYKCGRHVSSNTVWTTSDQQLCYVDCVCVCMWGGGGICLVAFCYYPCTFSNFLSFWYPYIS